MSGKQIEKRALSLLRSLEDSGKSVSRVTVEGHRIEIELSKPEIPADEFERIDMRHGKT